MGVWFSGRPLAHSSIRPCSHLQFTSTLASQSIQIATFETTASMSLQFHMEHDQTAGFQNDKIQPS